MYDVVVLGSGVAGMTAAAVCAAEGLSVLLLEKAQTVGGTTAISGGMAWMPANPKMHAAGLADSIETARTYLAQTAPGSEGTAILETFLQRSTEALEYLENHTSLRMRPVICYPDYYPDAAGATTGGRVLEPEPYDARALGQHFHLLAPPLPEFTLFGGMMISRADTPHFRRAGRSVASTLRVLNLCVRYAWQRLFLPRGADLYLGNALAARLLRSILDLGVELQLGSAVRHISHEGDGNWSIAIAEGTDERVIHARRGVILATGGFSHDKLMRQNLLPAESLDIHSASSPMNTGDGIRHAMQDAGARIATGNSSNAYWVPVSLHKRRNGSTGVYPHTVTDRTKPGVIAVDGNGNRFTNEARSYHEFVLAMLRESASQQPAVPCYLICDRTFLRKYGLGAVKPFAVFRNRHIRNGYLIEASTPESLAHKLGISSENLRRTLDAYNADAASGVDTQFRRGGDVYQRALGDPDVSPNPCVAPIVDPPYYAVRLYPGDLGTAAGLSTNENSQVLDAAGAPVSGLYACGNDMNSVMNGAYPGPGITIGPALTFGYIAARHISLAR